MKINTSNLQVIWQWTHIIQLEKDKINEILQDRFNFSKKIDSEQLYEVKVNTYIEKIVEILDLDKWDVELLHNFIHLNLEESWEFQSFARIAPLWLWRSIQEIDHNHFLDFLDTYSPPIEIVNKHDYLRCINDRDELYQELLIKIRQEIFYHFRQYNLNESLMSDLLKWRHSLVSSILKKMNKTLSLSYMSLIKHTNSIGFDEDLERLISRLEEDDHNKEILKPVNALKKSSLKKIIKWVIFQWYNLPSHDLLKEFWSEKISSIKNYLFDICEIDRTSDIWIIKQDYDVYDSSLGSDYAEKYDRWNLCTDHVDIIYFRIISELLDASWLYLIDEKIDIWDDPWKLTIKDIADSSPVYKTERSKYFWKNNDMQKWRIEVYLEVLKVLKKEHGDERKEYIKNAIIEYTDEGKKKIDIDDDIRF